MAIRFGKRDKTKSGKSADKVKRNGKLNGKTDKLPAMSAGAIRPFPDRQRALKDAYRECPAQARQVSSVHSVTPPGGETGKVRIAIENKAGVVVDIGAHHSFGGIEDVGCSGDYFLASLAGCYEVTLRLVAAASKLTINRLDLRIDADWDARGTLGLDLNVPVGFTSIRIVVDSTPTVRRSASTGWAS